MNEYYCSHLQYLVCGNIGGVGRERSGHSWKNLIMQSEVNLK